VARSVSAARDNAHAASGRIGWSTEDCRGAPACDCQSAACLRVAAMRCCRTICELELVGDVSRLLIHFRFSVRLSLWVGLRCRCEWRAVFGDRDRALGAGMLRFGSAP